MLNIEIHRTPKPKTLPINQTTDTLGFGRIFSDHMFFSRYREGLGWVESKIAPYGPISLDPAASVLHYGQSLFEGMKAFKREDGSIWLSRPDFNWQRMCEGAARLKLPLPSKDIFFEGLRSLLELDRSWIPGDSGCSIYIRPTLIGSEGFLGLRPSLEAIFFIILSPVGNYYAEGHKPIKIWVETEDLRAALGGLGNVKAGANYAASLRASSQAKKDGFSQVLWLDADREGIEEVGTMNVFFVFNDEIVTPQLNGSILPGSTRDSVLLLLRSREKFIQKKISERRITITELANRHEKGELKEVFGTGTAAAITSVGSIVGSEYTIDLGEEAGEISTILLKTIQGIQQGTIQDSFGWMRKLEDLSESIVSH